VARGKLEVFRPQVMRKLLNIDLESLDISQQLDLVRSYALMFIRTGPAKRNEKINLPAFPSGNPALDRELCELLVYLGRDNIIATTLDLMEAAESSIEADLTSQEVLLRSEQYGPTIAAMHENRPVEQGLAFALSLSNQETGWTPALRNRYFKWFYRALQKSGGASYKGFVEQIRLRALDKVPEREKKILAELSGEALLQSVATFNTDVPQPVGPGRAWTLGDVRWRWEGLNNRSFERGEQLYQALACSNCHAMKGQGGNVGPDLTQAGTRFSIRDLLTAMILPSVSISDQYGATLYTMKDGGNLIGRTLRSTEDSVYVGMNPFSITQETAIATSDISSSEPSPVSLMPPGLINSLNEEELKDLVAYLQSGGDPEHKVFGNSRAGEQ